MIEISLLKISKELNISIKRASNFLKSKGIDIEQNPNSKIGMGECELLINEYCYNDILKTKIISALFELQTENTQEESAIKGTNNSEFTINEHRKFRIVEQKDRSTILKDEFTEITYPSKKISKLVGDVVFMQIISIDGGKPRMRYSVLNDYNEGIEYSFNVIERKDTSLIVSNSEYITLSIPLIYENNIISNKIKLTVDKIDKVKNKLFFKSLESSHSKSENNLNLNEVFVVGEKYKFKTEGYRNINEDLSIILLDYNGFKTSVKAFPYQILRGELPETISCKINYITDNRIYLLQDRYDLFCELYEEDKKYEFEVVSLENDINTNSKNFILFDKYGFNHKLYNNEFENEEFANIEIGQTILLYIKRIDEKGHIVLNINASERNGVFITIETIFNYINIPSDIEKYFYFIKDELKKNIYKEKPYSQLFEDYLKKENLWIFSYLSFLNDYIKTKIRENQIDIALEFLDLYTAIEEWMLEGSDFLQKFSNEKRPIIIQKIENQLKNAQIKKEALLIIKNNQSDEYIQDVLKTLKLSNYLRDDKINIFKNLIFNTSFNNLKNTNEILEIILLLNKGNLLDQYDITNFISLLEHKISVEKYDLNPSMLNADLNSVDIETKNALQNIIKILGLQIILNKKNNNHENAVLKSSIMFRYLSHLFDDENIKIIFLKNAIDCIVSSKIIDLKTEHISNFNIDQFINIDFKIGKKEHLNELFGKEIYKKNGKIYSTGNVIFPKNSYINMCSFN